MSKIVEFEKISKNTSQKFVIKQTQSDMRVAILGWEQIDLTFDIQSWGNTIKVLIIGETKQKITIKANLQQDNAQVNLHIVSLGVGGNLYIDWWVYIPQGVKNVEGHLLEENLILTGKTKITSVPRLDVRANEVVASHGAKVQKLDEDKLFYVRSKWVWLLDAQMLLLSGYFEQFFEGLEQSQSLTEQLLQRLKSKLIDASRTD